MDHDDNQLSARRAALTTPIRTPTELDQLWRTLMGPLGFTRRKLWVLFLQADGVPVPSIVEIEDVPAHVDVDTCRSMMTMCQTMLDELIVGGSVAVLLTRSGRDGMRVGDRRWARALVEAAAEIGLALWPVHLANDVRLQVFAPDDLLPEAG